MTARVNDSDNTSDIYEDQINRAKDFTRELNSIISNGIADAIGTLAQGLADLATQEITGKEFGAQVLSVVGSFMTQMGMAFITFGSLFTAFQEAIAGMNGPLALGIGIALVAAGAVISGISKKRIKRNFVFHPCRFWIFEQ